MHLSATTDALLQLLTAAAAIADDTAIPILGNVLLTAAGDRLHVTATDTDLELQSSVQVEVTAPGTCTVSAKRLYQLLAKSAKGTASLRLSADGEAMSIAVGRARAKLPTLPDTDFPRWSDGEYSHSFGIASHVLAKLLRRAEYAASTEDERYYLHGVFLHAGGDNGQSLCAAATDGHRLTRIDTLLPGGAEGMPGIIIPTAAVKRVLKLLKGADVEFEVSDTRFRLSITDPAGDVTLSSKVIDGTYPDYERIIPKDDGQAIEVDRVALKSALSRAIAFASEKSKVVSLSMEAELLTLRATNPDSGEITEDLDAGEWSGRPLEIGTNAVYLAEAIAHLTGPRVRMVVRDAVSPIRIEDPSDPESLSILMPVRI
jgi:DNA polymerase III subunit beta